MRQSNGYILFFATMVCVVIGGSLALAYEVLKDKIKQNERVDTKTKILSAVMEIPAGVDIDKLYEENIESAVINVKGEEVDKILNDQGREITPEEVSIQKMNKKMKDQVKKKKDIDIYLPIFKFKSKKDTTKYDAYIVPMWGDGLWDWINGFIAIESDFNTVKGAVFDHKGETPGLGARITDAEVQERFIGKKMKSGNEFMSITVLKGENNVIAADDYHSVDGLSGASMTTNGVNDMLKKYFILYGPYFANLRDEEANKKDDTGVSNTNENPGNYSDF